MEIQFQPITFADRALFNSYFHAQYCENAHFTFTNLFMWREAYHIEWAEYKNCLLVKAAWEDDEYAIQPFGTEENVRAVMDDWIAYFKDKKQPFVMRGVEKKFAEWVRDAYPSARIESDRDDFDYVYLREDLATLKGRKYHGKKNHINALKKTCEYEYVPVSEDNIGECIESIRDWCRQRECYKDPVLSAERKAIFEVLEHFSELELVGGAVRINGKIEALTFGEMLNTDTAVIHVEKGNADIRGIYPLINQEFCLHAWEGATYINREEDMGVEGLRKAKESYRPCHMVEKYVIEIK